MKRILVIGGGASGMMAALTAARAGAQVHLLEKNEQLGRKLSQTGNGRCNLTNLEMSASAFRGASSAFVTQILSQFDAEASCRFFRELGVETRTRGSYVYPRADQAQSVTRVLALALSAQGVSCVTGCEPERLSFERKKSAFVLKSPKLQWMGDAVILACGSKAAPALGGTEAGYALAARFGHSITPLYPALAALRCLGKYYRQLAGVRTEARLSLRVDGRVLAEERGELQLTDYGLSGIPAFQLSRFAAEALAGGREPRVYVNFLPDMTEAECLDFLTARRELLAGRRAEDFLLGLLNNKLSAVLLNLAGIAAELPVESLNERLLRALSRHISRYEARVSSVNPFAQAQVCAGGVNTEELDARTLESRLQPGLYIAGELLDVDGSCGGYNLQWAWSSGFVAGRAAAV